MKTYAIGDRVAYLTAWGNGPQAEATILGEDTIESHGELVKVYDLSNSHWCYADQIINKVDPAPRVPTFELRASA